MSIAPRSFQDADALEEKLTHLEPQVAELNSRLGERDEDPAATRATNRELMSQLNSTSGRCR
jgi:hypothetical protein